ncbi:unnamed protein product [Amoebophrya sp. A25]|nr:unnamed protein product [Amoebophrya sp. A25]|eukprot:GSA25T00009088001.1
MGRSSFYLDCEQDYGVSVSSGPHVAPSDLAYTAWFESRLHDFQHWQGHPWYAHGAKASSVVAGTAGGWSAVTGDPDVAARICAKDPTCGGFCSNPQLHRSYFYDSHLLTRREMFLRKEIHDRAGEFENTSSLAPEGTSADMSPSNRWLCYGEHTPPVVDFVRRSGTMYKKAPVAYMKADLRTQEAEDASSSSSSSRDGDGQSAQQDGQGQAAQDDGGERSQQDAGGDGEEGVIMMSQHAPPRIFKKELRIASLSAGGTLPSRGVPLSDAERVHMMKEICANQSWTAGVYAGKSLVAVKEGDESKHGPMCHGFCYNRQSKRGYFYKDLLQNPEQAREASQDLPASSGDVKQGIPRAPDKGEPATGDAAVDNPAAPPLGEEKHADPLNDGPGDMDTPGASTLNAPPASSATQFVAESSSDSSSGLTPVGIQLRPPAKTLEEAPDVRTQNPELITNNADHKAADNADEWECYYADAEEQETVSRGVVERNAKATQWDWLQKKECDHDPWGYVSPDCKKRGPASHFCLRSRCRPPPPPSGRRNPTQQILGFGTSLFHGWDQDLRLQKTAAAVLFGNVLSKTSSASSELDALYTSEDPAAQVFAVPKNSHISLDAARLRNSGAGARGLCKRVAAAFSGKTTVGTLGVLRKGKLVPEACSGGPGMLVKTRGDHEDDKSRGKDQWFFCCDGHEHAGRVAEDENAVKEDQAGGSSSTMDEGGAPKKLGKNLVCEPLSEMVSPKACLHAIHQAFVGKEDLLSLAEKEAKCAQLCFVRPTLEKQKGIIGRIAAALGEARDDALSSVQYLTGLQTSAPSPKGPPGNFRVDCFDPGSRNELYVPGPSSLGLGDSTVKIDPGGPLDVRKAGMWPIGVVFL